MTVPIDSSTLFQRRAAPSGGWQRMQQRLHQRRSTTPVRWAWSVAFVPLLALIAIAFWPAPAPPALHLQGVTHNPPGPRLFIIEDGKRRLLSGSTVNGMQFYELDQVEPEA